MCAIVNANSRACLYRHVTTDFARDFILAHCGQGGYASEYTVYEYGIGWYSGNEWLREFE